MNSFFDGNIIYYSVSLKKSHLFQVNVTEEWNMHTSNYGFNKLHIGKGNKWQNFENNVEKNAEQELMNIDQ